MGGVRGGDHVGVLELDGSDREVLEETGAAAEEHGSQVDADLVWKVFVIGSCSLSSVSPW